jgi:hypothetical protein
MNPIHPIIQLLDNELGAVLSSMVFSVNCEHEQQGAFFIRLHESNAFASVTSLGGIEHE